MKYIKDLKISLIYDELESLGEIIERLVFVQEHIIEDGKFNLSNNQEWIPVFDFMKKYDQDIISIDNNSLRKSKKMVPNSYEIEELPINCVIEMTKMGLGNYCFLLKLVKKKRIVLDKLLIKIQRATT